MRATLGARSCLAHFFRRDGHQPAKGGTLPMAWRGAGGGMAQSVTQGDQAVDLPIDLLGLGFQPRALQANVTLALQHRADLLQRKAG